MRSVPKILDFYEDTGFDVIYLMERTPFIFFRKEPLSSKLAITGDYIFMGSDVKLQNVRFIQERFLVISGTIKNPETEAESSITYFYYFQPRKPLSSSTHIFSEINSCLKELNRETCFFAAHNSEFKNLYKLSDDSNMVFELISQQPQKQGQKLVVLRFEEKT